MQHQQTIISGNELNMASFPIFRHLTSEEIIKLRDEKSDQIYNKGQSLYHEKNRLKGIFCIYSGTVKVYKTGIDGKEQIIRFAKKGEIIAFRSILSQELACTSAKAIEESHVGIIPGEFLIYLVKNNGNFSLDLLQLTCRELEESNSYLTDIAQKTVRERLAEVLLDLKENFGLDNKSILNITLTREELANIVGTATESVIRLLSEFREDNIITLEGRKIKLLNIPKLQKTANLFS